MATLPRFGIWYDFRNPEQWYKPLIRMYGEYLDQIAMAEELGFQSVWLTEHHFQPDHYASSPLTIAGAISQRTRTMQIATDLMVLPLHNPVRMAEDVATLSILSNGRFDLGVGVGYRPKEFEQFGQNMKHRPSLIEEGIEILRRAWSGQSVDFRGKRYTVNNYPITPHPERAPKIYVGGLAEPAVERAARIGDGFIPSGTIGLDHYLKAYAELGKDPADAVVIHGSWAIIAPDPEEEARRVGPHAMYQTNIYRSWGVWGPDQTEPFATPAEALEGGLYEVWDADMAVQKLQALIDQYPQIRDIHFWAQLPGEPVEAGNRRLAYMAKEVFPRLRPARAQG